MNQACWRDCKAWKDDHMPLSTTNNEAAQMCDAVITQFTGSYEHPSVGGLEKAMERLMQADPDFVLGKSLLLGMDLMCVAQSYSHPELKNRVDSLEQQASKSSINEWEKKHIKAVCHFGRGEWNEACLVWEDILLDHPIDAMALKFVRDTYFYQGGLAQQRDLLIRTMKHWTEQMPLYSTFLGHRAFAYGEMNQHVLAEKEASRALELDPGTNWARHALAHTLDATCRHTESSDMLTKTMNIWTAPEQQFICHLNWHHALSFLEQGNTESALGILDNEILPSVQRSKYMFSLADSSSLLMRLEMAGVKIGAERWESLRELYRPHIDDHVLTFHDAHMYVTYAHASTHQEGEDVMAQVTQSLQDFVRTKSEYSAGVLRDVGIPLAEACTRYRDGDYAGAVQNLFPIRYDIQKIGGSNAQRDVFQQFLIYCCTKSPCERQRTLGRHLLVEREALRGDTPLLHRLSSHLSAQHDG